MDRGELIAQCIDSANEAYKEIYLGKGAHADAKVAANFDALLESCLNKFDAWKSSLLGNLFKSEPKTLDNYIKYLNQDQNTHHHARMLFQTLFKVIELDKKYGMEPTAFTDNRKTNFFENVATCVDQKVEIIASTPKNAGPQYSKFQGSLGNIEKSLIADQVLLAMNDNTPIPDQLAKDFYQATVGAGDSFGKQLSDEFMKQISASPTTIKMDRLIELTTGVMRAQQASQVTGAEHAFLRRTGVITDKLYLLSAQLLNYNPLSETPAPLQIVRLNKEILIGKGFEDKPTHDNSDAINNAAVEINFKLTGNPKPLNQEKLAQEVINLPQMEAKTRESVRPPPIPESYMRQMQEKNRAQIASTPGTPTTSPATPTSAESAPPVPPRPTRMRR